MDPTEAKLAAEAAYFEAQTAKIHKELEPPPKLPQIRKTLLETLALFGSLIVGVGGFVTAFTGYQLAEAKKERMEAEITKRQVDLDQLERTYEIAQSQQQSNLTQAQKQLNELKEQLETLKATAAAPPQPNVEGAINKANAVQNTLKTVDKAQKDTKTEVNRAIKKIGVPIRF
jgi:DNA repair exonuclease SbcCD ATPase subunit